jgi:hypothetical protein
MPSVRTADIVAPPMSVAWRLAEAAMDTSVNEKHSYTCHLTRDAARLRQRKPNVTVVDRLNEELMSPTRSAVTRTGCDTPIPADLEDVR